MKVFRSLVVLAVLGLAAGAVHAQNKGNDPNKPVTHLLVRITGDVRTERPLVLQWSTDEEACQKVAREANVRFKDAGAEFVCVRIVREAV